MINILGAGLAGLSAAVTLAKEGIKCNLISCENSERSQSVLAEGGINACLNTMGENDGIEEHFNDTLKGGVFCADPNAVFNLVSNAPSVIERLSSIGVPFNRENGHIVQRNFGGQKKKRTAFAQSSTGKILMTCLIAECRKYEKEGTVSRYAHHQFIGLLYAKEGECSGLAVKDLYSQKEAKFFGPVILCCGGLAGFFPGKTTGSVLNTGFVASRLFYEGVKFSNLEMIQYHPTTIPYSGKRLLLTEAARGEGAKLFAYKNGEKVYFMEERFPESGSLSPRDVVSREEYFVLHDKEFSPEIFLDTTLISQDTWKNKLSDLRAQLIEWTGIDPCKKEIKIEPGIHYFMGGIDVDEDHGTSVKNLYAAGECCSQYHGANRLGGNSLLGAIYGGIRSAQTVIKSGVLELNKGTEKTEPLDGETCAEPSFCKITCGILYESLGIVRSEEKLNDGLQKIQELMTLQKDNSANYRHALFAKAMILSALNRKESRGAHYRSDFPEPDDSFRKKQSCCFDGTQIVSEFVKIPELKKTFNKGGGI